LDPNNPIYWHNRGCCLRNIERFEEAFQDFNKAISLDPENPVIYSNRGLV
jgi:Flp pilus assembly protein TadD, contains TPR repeats